MPTRTGVEVIASPQLQLFRDWSRYCLIEILIVHNAFDPIADADCWQEPTANPPKSWHSNRFDPPAGGERKLPSPEKQVRDRGEQNSPRPKREKDRGEQNSPRSKSGRGAGGEQKLPSPFGRGARGEGRLPANRFGCIPFTALRQSCRSGTPYLTAGGTDEG